MCFFGSFLMGEKKAHKQNPPQKIPGQSRESCIYVFCSLCVFFCMPNMTGRPGHQTMEMNGGSSAPYVACTPCVPLLCTSFDRGGNKALLDYQGRAGDHFHCTVEPLPGHIRCGFFGSHNLPRKPLLQENPGQNPPRIEATRISDICLQIGCAKIGAVCLLKLCWIGQPMLHASLRSPAAKSHGCGDLRPWSLRASCSCNFEGNPQIARL